MPAALPRDPNQISDRAQFAQALSELRERAHLSVRQLSKLVGVPAGTLGDYFSGRHLPSAAQAAQLRALLAECGVHTEAEQDDWLAALRRVRGARRSAGRPANPYPGLRPFDSDDADLYFGRDAHLAAVLALLTRLRDDPGPACGALAVVGASGSGKSSLLRAGVLPAVRAGALGPAVTWAVTTPGRELTVPSGSRLLVVDQLEEVFSAEVAPAARATYLRDVTGRPAGTLTLLALRADFYPAAMAEPTLMNVLQHNQLLVGPMTAEELRAAIVEPARRHNAVVEPALVDLLVAAVRPRDAAHHGHEQGALPLLNHCLCASWERCDGTTVTVADYHESGGIEGSVQQSAERAYRSLDEADQALARQLFLRLAHVEHDVVPTRRRLRRPELTALGESGGRFAAVLDTFVAARLITVDADGAQLTHEALMTAWPRLRGWLEENRDGQRVHRQLTDAANEWAASGRDEGALLRGGRLAAAAEWAAQEQHAQELTPRERELLAASLDAQQRERKTMLDRTRRLRALLAACAVLALIAGSLAAYALRARATADRARAIAAAARDDALSRQVAIQARELAASDPALAAQLAVAAYRIAPTDEARGTLIASSDTASITRVLGAQGPTPLALSPGGALVAVGHADDGSVHLYRLGAGDRPAAAGVIHGTTPSRELFALAFTPDGRTLVTAGQASTVDLWAVGSSRPTLVAALPTGAPAGSAVQAVALSPDGRTLAVAGAGPSPLQLWDVSRPARATRLPAPAAVPAQTTLKSVQFSPDGRQLAAGAAGAGGGLVLRWAVAGGRTTGAPDTARRPNSVTALAYSPDSRTLFAGDTGGVITGYRAAAALTAITISVRNASGAQINVLAAAPDGTSLFAGSSDDTVQKWDTATGALLSSTPHPGPVTGLAVDRSGTTELDTAADGALRLTSTAQPSLPTHGTVFSVGFDADGDRLAVINNPPDPGLQMWDVRQPTRPAAVGPRLTMSDGVAGSDGTGAISPSGAVVALGDSEGYVELCDETNPAQPRPLGPPFRAAGGLVETIAFSPDGTELAVADDDDAVHLWDVGDPAHPVQLAVLRGHSLMLAVAFSADGRLLAGGNADKTVRIWDVRDPRRPRKLATLLGSRNYVYGVAFSADSRLLAETGADDSTRLWNVRVPSHPRRVGPTLIGPNDYVNAPSFSPDGRLLAVGSNDHTVWLYDVSDPAHASALATLRGVDGNVFATAFSPDGRTLAAGGRYSAVLLWDVDTAADISAVCRTAGDPITRAEWRRFVPGAPYRRPCA